MKFFLLLLGIGSAFSLDIVVPAYFSPADRKDDWDKMALAASTGTPVTVIMNPNSGPGSAINDAYSLVVEKVRLAGTTILGYVTTKKETKPMNELKKDIDNYFNWYNPHGIFIEGLSKEKSSLQYYRDIYNHIKQNGSHRIVVVNGEERIPDFYLSSTTIANRFVNFADNDAKYATADVNKPTHSFIHLVYDTTKSKLAKDLKIAEDRKVCGIYLTERTGAEKNKALPVYWDDLVAQVNIVNNS